MCADRIKNLQSALTKIRTKRKSLGSKLSTKTRKLFGNISHSGMKRYLTHMGIYNEDDPGTSETTEESNKVVEIPDEHVGNAVISGCTMKIATELTKNIENPSDLYVIQLDQHLNTKEGQPYNYVIATQEEGEKEDSPASLTVVPMQVESTDQIRNRDLTGAIVSSLSSMRSKSKSVEKGPLADKLGGLLDSGDAEKGRLYRRLPTMELLSTLPTGRLSQEHYPDFNVKIKNHIKANWQTFKEFKGNALSGYGEMPDGAVDERYEPEEKKDAGGNIFEEMLGSVASVVGMVAPLLEML